MAVIPQTAKCHHNQGTDSLGQGDTLESGIITVTEKEVCIPFWMQLNQLWLCLIGVLLSIHHYSTLDKEMLPSRVLETLSQLSKLQGQGHWKIGSGESVTWLVSSCDVTAGLLPLRYIFVWQKLYVWLYHDGNHHKTRSKCFAFIDLKKYWHQYFGWICWYLQSNPILRINFTLLLQIRSSESCFEKLPIWPRGIYCCFVSYAQILLERLQKRQNLHILLKLKRVFSSMYGGKEDVLNCL